jgi:hypothetical protein
MSQIADQSISISSPVEELVIEHFNSDLSGRRTLREMEQISSNPNLCYQYVHPNTVYSEEMDGQFLDRTYEALEVIKEEGKRIPQKEKTFHLGVENLSLSEKTTKENEKHSSDFFDGFES